MLSENGEKMFFHSSVDHRVVALVDGGLHEVVCITDCEEVTEGLWEEVGDSELEPRISGLEETPWEAYGGSQRRNFLPYT